LKKKLFNFLKVAAFFAIGVFLFWYVLRNESISLIISKLKNANYWWAVLALALGLISNISRTMRWNMLIESLGYHPKLKNSFAALMVGYLANLAVPRLGEVSRCLILHRYEKIPAQKTLGTVFVERAIDVITLLILLVLILALQYQRFSSFAYSFIFQPLISKIKFLLELGGIYYFIIFGILVFAVIGGWWLFKRFSHSHLFKRIQHLFEGFADGLKSVMKMKNRNLFLLHTIFIWVIYYFMSYVCFFAFGATQNLGFMAALAVLVFGTFGFAAPVQGGIGLYETLVMQTLLLFGLDKDDGLAFAIYSHLTQLLGMLVIGLLALTLLPIINRHYVPNVNTSANTSTENNPGQN
jgi:glycosyltransferase 2 family protein